MINFRVHRDEGFTLVELLIAIVIMGISVAVFVLALSSLSVATENHRGHSVNETLARDFAEAISAKASYATTLAQAITDPASNTACLSANPTNFGSTVVGMYLVIDTETVKVVSGTGSDTCPNGSFNLKVTRGVGSRAATHLNNSRVRQLTVCPDATTAASSANNPSWIGYLNPDNYSPPASYGNVGVSITNVSYVDLDPALTSPQYTWTQSQCMAYFRAHCEDTSSSVGSNANGFFDLLPECDPGLELLTLTITDKNVTDGAAQGSTDCATGALCTTTQMFVRRGGH